MSREDGSPVSRREALGTLAALGSLPIAGCNTEILGDSQTDITASNTTETDNNRTTTELESNYEMENILDTVINPEDLVGLLKYQHEHRANLEKLLTEEIGEVSFAKMRDMVTDNSWEYLKSYYEDGLWAPEELQDADKFNGYNTGFPGRITPRLYFHDEDGLEQKFLDAGFESEGTYNGWSLNSGEIELYDTPVEIIGGVKEDKCIMKWKVQADVSVFNDPWEVVKLRMDAVDGRSQSVLDMEGNEDAELLKQANEIINDDSKAEDVSHWAVGHFDTITDSEGDIYGDVYGIAGLVYDEDTYEGRRWIIYQNGDWDYDGVKEGPMPIVEKIRGG